MTQPDDRSDAKGVEAVLSGDTDAFRLLVDRYERRVFSLVCRMVWNRSDAEDLSQEFFCKLFQNLHPYDPALPLQNWLMRIASTHTLNFVDRRSLPRVSLDERREDGSRPYEPSDPAPSPADRAELGQ